MGKRKQPLSSAWKSAPRSKVIQVIETEYAVGACTAEDPLRAVVVYRTLDGHMLAIHDEVMWERMYPKFRKDR